MAVYNIGCSNQIEAVISDRFDPDEINAWIDPVKATHKTSKTSDRKRISSIDSLIQDAISDVALVEREIPGSYKRW